jgi:hypothetical protein
MERTMKAIFLNDLPDWQGDAKLFKVDPVIRYSGACATDHVVVSKVNHAFAHETYIFPANSVGEVIDWVELEGSACGEHSHDDVLRSLGYEVS